MAILLHLFFVQPHLASPWAYFSRKYDQKSSVILRTWRKSRGWELNRVSLGVSVAKASVMHAQRGAWAATTNKTRERNDKADWQNLNRNRPADRCDTLYPYINTRSRQSIRLRYANVHVLYIFPSRSDEWISSLHANGSTEYQTEKDINRRARVHLGADSSVAECRRAAMEWNIASGQFFPSTGIQ